jgi:hypothetical protein
MKRILTIFIFAASPVFAQGTNLTTPVTLGPVSVAHDTSSISAIDWANAGQGVTFALRMDVPKMGGGVEPFFHRAYPYGLSSEYAGLWEVMTERFSFRYNFRYAHLLPRTKCDGPEVYFGDRLDTSALYIQKVGKCRVDESNNYIIDPETGQPYLDNQAVELTARTFRGEEVGGLDAGDIRFITRGVGRQFEFRGGPKSLEATYATIGPSGLHVFGENILGKIAALEARIAALEAAQ